MSLRFARDVACDYSTKDCQNLDFLYTLRADSPIVGGPSAGAASTILTLAELEGFTLKKNVSITGTINSGGIIGNVGGISEKIEGAKETGITTVLIPRSSHNTEDVNSTQNSSAFIEQGAQRGVTVIGVATIREALPLISNGNIAEQKKEIQIAENYKETMKDVARQMCQRTEQLIAEAQEQDAQILNASKDAERVLGEEKYYSASSYCFNANIQLRKKLYQNLSDADFATIAESLYALKIDEIPLASPNNIQIYLIVHDRFEDLQNLLEDAQKAHTENLSSESRELLASAHERAYSIAVWLKFLDTVGPNGDTFDLKTSCAERSAEANERLQYAKIYFPLFVEEAEERLELAKLQQGEEKYANCISNAVEAKVLSNMLLTSIGLTREQLPELVTEKRVVAAAEIAEQEYFPILAYSYYEYAQSLQEDDPSSSLLYVEYALELANIDNYLSREKKEVPFAQRTSMWITEHDKELRFASIGTLGGLLFGSVLSLYALERSRRKKKR